MATSKAKQVTDESKYASRGEIERVLDDMPDSHVECRRYGHRWVPHTASWDAAARVFDEGLRCTRCKARRAEVISEWGSKLSGNIDYSGTDGYLLKDVGRIVGDGRDALRLAAITRRMERKKGKS